MKPSDLPDILAVLEEAQVAVAVAASENPQWVALWQRIEAAVALLRAAREDAGDEG